MTQTLAEAAAGQDPKALEDWKWTRLQRDTSYEAPVLSSGQPVSQQAAAARARARGLQVGMRSVVGGLLDRYTLRVCVVCVHDAPRSMARRLAGRSRPTQQTVCLVQCTHTAVLRL